MSPSKKVIRRCSTCLHLSKEGQCPFILNLPDSPKNWMCEKWQCAKCGGGFRVDHQECQQQVYIH